MKKCGLLQEITSALDWCISRHASSLILDVSNNPAEQYNSHVNKFLGGRRVNYALRGSYKMRCELAVVSFNHPGQAIGLVQTAITGKEPGLHTKRHEARKERRLQNLRMQRSGHPEQRFGKKRTPVLGIDEDYGLQERDNFVQLTAEEVDSRKSQLLQSLELTDAERSELERKTVLQSKCPLWFEEKRKRVTASWFGKACKMKPTTSCRGNVSSMLYKHVSTAAMHHGVTNEPIAKEKMAQEHAIISQECGLFVDQELPFLGASPDGLVGEEAIMEVKCPFSADSFLTPREAHEKKKLLCCDLVDGKPLLKRNSNYFYQIQGQLHITKRRLCYFVLYTKHWLSYEIIEKDDQFWEKKMADQLKRFYMNCYLPELISPQYGHRLVIGDIVDPQYSTDAQKAAAAKKNARSA